MANKVELGVLGLLLCRLGRHTAGPPFLTNREHRFARCVRCECDLVRTDGPWARPKGYRVVWPDDCSPLAEPPTATQTQGGVASRSDDNAESRREQAAQALLAILDSLGSGEAAPAPAPASEAPTIAAPSPSPAVPPPPAPPASMQVIEELAEPTPPEAPAPEVAAPFQSPPLPPPPEPATVAAPVPTVPAPPEKSFGHDFMSDDESDHFDWNSSPRPAPAASAPAPRFEPPRREQAPQSDSERRSLLAGEVPRG